MWNSFAPLAYLLCQHRAVLHVVSAHLGSSPRPSAPVTALSLMPVANVLYGRVGAVRQRIWFYSLGDADSSGLLGAVWDGGPISHLALDTRGLTGPVCKYFPGMNTAHTPPRGSSTQPAFCCQKNLPEIPRTSHCTITPSAQTFGNGLASPVSSHPCEPAVVPHSSFTSRGSIRESLFVLAAPSSMRSSLVTLCVRKRRLLDTQGCPVGP